jgi:hypothetical protein
VTLWLRKYHGNTWPSPSRINRSCGYLRRCGTKLRLSMQNGGYAVQIANCFLQCAWASPGSKVLHILCTQPALMTALGIVPYRLHNFMLKLIKSLTRTQFHVSWALRHFSSWTVGWKSNVTFLFRVSLIVRPSVGLTEW